MKSAEKKKSVVVFCSASDQAAPVFFSEISELARALVRADFQIVYGGGRSGLMGRLADEALACGGSVVGVIPKYLAKEGILHPGLTELIVVDDLLDRKRKMLDLSAAAIAYPGGIGTIDEITEVLALKQLNEVVKPVVFHNFLQFWDPLFHFFDELVQRRMIHQKLEDLYVVREGHQEVVEYLNHQI